MKPLSKEKVVVSSDSVSCKGKEFPYDHPLVYLSIKDDSHSVTCPYCSKEFVMDGL